MTAIHGWSPSSRRAWIEISSTRWATTWTMVALLAEGVDRNDSPRRGVGIGSVALLAEGVDRNQLKSPRVVLPVVALLAEGVDRNISR